jgi:hypothetical protein
MAALIQIPGADAVLAPASAISVSTTPLDPANAPIASATLAKTTFKIEGRVIQPTVLSLACLRTKRQGSVSIRSFRVKIPRLIPQTIPTPSDESDLTGQEISTG